MITLHHLEHSRSQRVLWMLEELGVDYRIKRYARDPETNLAPPALNKVHALGKSPVLVDGDRTLAESAVIIEYLARRYGGGDWAPGIEDPAYWQFSYWMHYAEASLMPPLLIKLVFSKLREAPVPFFVRPVSGRIADRVDAMFTDPQIATHFAWVDAFLAEHEWFAGDAISAADVQMSFPLEAALARGTVTRADYPHVAVWVHKVQGRPAYRRALKAGGDYAYGPIDTPPENPE
ncbi:MAG: glutathione S-transferase [Wenzhouxiangellaceae bacterium]|nr:glutathione S-transferase [Wenzhouxiangellaceae bacterium]